MHLILKISPKFPHNIYGQKNEKPCYVAQVLHLPLIEFQCFFLVTLSHLNKNLGLLMKRGGVMVSFSQRTTQFMPISSPVFIVTWIHYFTCLSLRKQKAQRKIYVHCCNALALLEGFLQSCLGKRLSLRYFAKQDSSHIVEEYFQRSLGESFNNLGYGKFTM